MATEIDLNDFMGRMTEVLDYAVRRLVHARPAQSASPVDDEGEALPTTIAAAPPSLVDGTFELPPGVEPGVESSNQFSVMDKLVEFHVENHNIQRRNIESITQFIEQSAIDNQRDNDELERIVYQFLDSRHTATDV